jgi:GNAT superfamily N-acetyltransferase
VSALVRPIDPRSPAEIEIVAERMRQTLVEVLGEVRGTSMYTMDWLRDRVRFHLDPARSTAEVFLAEDDGRIVGHTIVRVEVEDGGRSMGLFSTTYVEPAHRRGGVASLLLERGEAWMRARSLGHAVTYTDEGNARLIRLYEKHGYRIVDAQQQMVKLEKAI